MVEAMNRALDMSFHIMGCDGCDFCAEERKRRTLRAFDGAGEDERCPDCGNYSPPWNITDEVEDVIL